MRRFFFVAANCSLFFLISFPSVAGTTVGQFKQVGGLVFVTHEARKAEAALEKSPLLLKDIVETKKGSAAQLAFNDGTTLILRENSKIVVTRFLFNPKQKKRETVVSILFGKVKAVIAKTFDKKSSKTELKTPTAVVGIRGTEIALEVTRSKTKIFCLKGLLEVFNPSFPQKIIQIPAGKFSDALRGKIPGLPLDIPAEILRNIEDRFGFPTSLRGGVEQLKSRVPIPLPGGFPGF